MDISKALKTGIKVIDLLAPYAKGGKIGLFGAGVGKTVSGAYPKYCHREWRVFRVYRRGRTLP